MDLSGIEIAFEYGWTDEAQRREIIRNVQTVLATPKGTCPLYRDFGINATYLDYPLDVAQNLMAVEVIEAIEKWEPRVKVKDVIFKPDPEGKLRTKVVIAGG